MATIIQKSEIYYCATGWIFLNNAGDKGKLIYM